MERRYAGSIPAPRAVGRGSPREEEGRQEPDSLDLQGWRAAGVRIDGSSRRFVGEDIDKLVMRGQPIVEVDMPATRA